MTVRDASSVCELGEVRTQVAGGDAMLAGHFVQGGEFGIDVGEFAIVPGERVEVATQFA